MLQGEYDIRLIANDTWSGATFTILVNDVAIDLSEATVEMLVTNNGKIILTKSNQPTVVEEVSTPGGITLTGPNSFAIDEFTLTGIPDGIYKYAIRITFHDGKIKTYIKGLFTVLKGATDG